MSNIEPSQDAIRKAADVVGGFAELGRKIGVTPQAVSAWYMRGRVPPTRVLEIERVTGVSRHALRPDIYPVESAAAQ